MRERPLRKTFMHMMRSRHPSLSARELLTLLRHAIMPDDDDEDEDVDDLSEDMALSLAMVRHRPPSMTLPHRVSWDRHTLLAMQGNAPTQRGPDQPR